MADVQEMRIFSAEQIEVHMDLPSILKAFSKEVIRQSPTNIVSFSRGYFESILKAQGYNFDENQAVSSDSAHLEEAFKIEEHGEEWSIGDRRVRRAINKKDGLKY